METMPERINVIRSITYDVSKVVEDLKEMEVDLIDLETVMNYIAEWVEEDIGIDSVMEYIEDWVAEDMTAPLSRHDLTYLDENGQEL